MKTILFILLSVVAFSAFSKNVVIMNASNSNAISEADIKKIFLGKKGAFDDGSKVLPVTYTEGDAIRAAFNDGMLGKSETKYVAYWSKMLFTGAGVPPQEVASQDEMLDVISKNPSTIGIIEESKVNDSVKVVASF
ncbi:phosphate ABC transporter substrate-binding protein [Aestuariibacter sp. AA17]|uniref:Phosphate ABC transporter substrate-binding protein n=1 Tax=Fluctibacter corallii TaxID=2984329 RepID=A0ABT3AAA7_9ALTE|nr:phosphate ABC transporter substrate-binding protein [Aestuariibacter sp. AA17]MCV2885589.1 phosphate ABC transporter substrate-binding protein [Aestuariibacter sp. AA17]